jgi:hypothetical protein
LFVIIYIFIQKHSICNIGTTITFRKWWNNIIYNIYKLIVLKKGYKVRKSWAIVVNAQYTYFCIFYSGNKFHFIELMYAVNTLTWVFTVLALWNDSTLGRYVSPRRHIILIPRKISLSSSSLMLRTNRRRNKWQFYSLCFTRPSLERMIYHTRDNHANNYITDTVARSRSQRETAVVIVLRTR